jgi:hypothetical protein
MATYKVAHVTEQGQQVILILVNRSFGSLSNADQKEAFQALQACATAADLAGHVALVWETGSYGPTQWQAFLGSLSYRNVLASINRELTCG